MSGRQNGGATSEQLLAQQSNPALDTLATIGAASEANDPLGGASTFCTSNIANPIERTVHVSLRDTLDNLAQRRGAPTWAPSPAALKRIFQQTKFVDLGGKAERHGDMKSVVLHSVTLENATSDFPFAIGARIAGVDANTYTLNGEAFSHVLPPSSVSTSVRTLQEDDVKSAYEFSQKFPGYTADNLAIKGVHEVTDRNFALVAADHPICAAIQENAANLQTGEISMMPEGLVKIHSNLYKTMAPAVHAQVSSQLRVRDFTTAAVAFQPTEYPTWSAAKSAMVKQQQDAVRQSYKNEGVALGAATGAISNEEKLDCARVEATAGHTPHNVNLTLKYRYNFLAE